MADGLNRTPERINGKLTTWGKFVQHRRDAAGRNIPFLLSFDEWWQLWKASGRWHSRGPKRGQYVMARYGDKGPYSAENVKIILVLENALEAHVGKKRPKSLKWRKQHSKTMTGRVLTEAHKAAISAGLERNPSIKHRTFSAEHCANLSAAMKGRKQVTTPQRRANLSAAMTKMWARRKAEQNVRAH